MKRFTGYVLALVAVLLITAVAFEAPQALNAQGKGGGAGVKGVLCEHIQSVAGNPTAAAIALCGDLLFKTVFVWSTTHSGNLKTAGGGATGLEGADNIASPPTNPTALCGDLLFKTVFVWSTTHSGNLKTAGGGATGLEGADNICNDLAQAANLPGTFTAWLSDSTADAKDRVTQSVVPYNRTDGVRVADNFADLTDCGNPDCLQAPIDRNEFGVQPGLKFAFTGTGPTGDKLGPFCSDWEAGGAATGRLGNEQATNATWTTINSQQCVNGRRGFCFQD